MRLNLKEIEKIDWLKTVTRPQFLYGQVPHVMGERDFLLEKVKFGFRNRIFFPSEGGHTQYFDKEEWNKFSLTIKEKIEKEKDWLSKYSEEVYEMCKDITTKLELISNEDLSSADNEKLLKYLSLLEGIRKKFTYALYPPLVIEGVLEEKLKEELKNTLKEIGEESLFNEYMNIITTKTQFNESDEEEIELLKIAQEFKEKGDFDEKLEDKLQEHAEKYAWLPYYGYGLPIGDKEYFKQQIKKIENPEDKLKEKEKKYKIQKEKIEKVKTKFKGKHIMKLIDIVQTYLHLRTLRTEVLRKIYYYPRPLLMEIAKRMKIKFDDILFLTPDEIREALKKGVNPFINKEIKERREHYAIVMINGNIEIISDEKEIKDLGKVLVKKEEKKILKGIGVYPGRVKGTVKVITNIKEISKVKAGDILVTTMTTPEMHLAIEKATGIITDEGGLTSHAAVVSRELHIPCVIGTGEATRILHDGDVVILDSEKGIVEVISEEEK